MFIVQATVVEQVHPSDDTKVCNVTIRNSKGIYTRPIVNLIPLKQNYHAECTLIVMLGVIMLNAVEDNLCLLRTLHRL
jgi:phosphotransferase system HPr-like phosphotransfer protein